MSEYVPRPTNSPNDFTCLRLQFITSANSPNRTKHYQTNETNMSLCLIVYHTFLTEEHHEWANVYVYRTMQLTVIIILSNKIDSLVSLHRFDFNV